MNLNRVKKIYAPPTPEERRANIAATKWALFDMFEYSPHSAQMDGHMSDARFRMLIAGTRGGKSRMAGEEAIPYIFAGATRIWIVGQNYSLTEKEYRYIYDRMTSPQVVQMFGTSWDDYMRTLVYNVGTGDMRLETRWGAEVQCISLERAHGAFGEEVDLIIMSEAAQIKRPKDLYERILRGRLASRLGDVLIPTTPSGRTNKYDQEGWLHDMYRKGYDPDEPDYYTREWPSWENPGFLDDPYEIRRSIDSRVFSEQYEGKFMVFSGAVYNTFDERVHVLGRFAIPKHWNRYESIDPGFSGRFVWLSAVISETGNVYVVDEYSDSKQMYEDRAAAIMNHRCDQYRIPHGSSLKEASEAWKKFSEHNNIKTTLYIDPEDPQCIAELGRYDLFGLKAFNNISVGVDRVSKRLKWSDRYPPTLYVGANCTETIEAMKMHSWGEKGTGERTPANDQYKHWCDCMRYICAGNLVESDPVVREHKINGVDLYGLMLETSERGRGNIIDRNAYARRGGYLL